MVWNYPALYLLEKAIKYVNKCALLQLITLILNYRYKHLQGEVKGLNLVFLRFLCSKRW